MREEFRKITNYIIIFLFVLAVLYGGYALIKSKIEDYQASKQPIVNGIENIDDYIITEDTEVVIDGNVELKASNIVTGYQEFYTVQNAIDNYIGALINGKYKETYAITTQDIRAVADEATYVQRIQEFTQKNFVSSDAMTPYENYNNVRILYKIDTDAYIGEVVTANNEIVRIGVVLNTENSTYRVFYVEIS